jgi:hypothetical protein
VNDNRLIGSVDRLIDHCSRFRRTGADRGELQVGVMGVVVLGLGGGGGIVEVRGTKEQGQVGLYLLYTTG